MMKRLISTCFIYIVCIFSNNVYSTEAKYSHGFAKYGSLKYSKDFTHFNYVNPNAPKQGQIVLSLGSSLFDKFNPFTLKGDAAPAISMLMFDTLGVSSLDEDSSFYGLIADQVLVKDNKIVFHINEAAKFNNNDSITAKDVKFSFDTLIKYGIPTFKFLYADIIQCIVIDNNTVSFEMSKKNDEMPLLLSSLPVFSQKWLGNKKFSDLVLDVPIASSPYLIDKYYQGRSIRYKLNPNYWAKNHPTRKGMFNFQYISFENYQDDIAKLEALKSGSFDANIEYRAKNWAKSYTGKLFEKKILVKKEFINSNGNGMQGFAFNHRRDLFKDIRVRQALSLALDFEWMNKQLFYNSYTRLDSYFSNTVYASSTPMLDLEKKYLHQAGFNPSEYEILNKPAKNLLPNSLRLNLVKAQELLKQAGWEYKNGALRNKHNKIFSFEILASNDGLSRVIAAYVRNLQKLGITVTQRTMDSSIYQKRIEKFDFDMISIRYGDSNLPGNELWERFSSNSAKTFGSDNVVGVNDKRIDKLLQFVISSKNKDDLIASTRALDRILLNNYYIIPHWYSKSHRIAYRAFLKYPKVLPLFFNAESWLISTWWHN